MRYAIARDPGRVVVPGLAHPLPIVQEPPERPSAVVLAFVPPAAPSVSVGLPRAVVPPVPIPSAALPASAPTSSGVPAVAVGVRAGGSTVLTMTPADLWDGPRSDITEFTIVSIAAGNWS